MTDGLSLWRSAAYRHARDRDQARATLAAVREYLETSDDTGVRTREHCLGMLDRAGVPSVVAAELGAQPEPIWVCLGFNRIAASEQECSSPACRCHRENAEMSAKLRAAYPEVFADGAAAPATDMTLAEAMEIHRLTGEVIDREQQARWTAAGRCGTCGWDGDRTGCQDCDGGQA